MDYLVDLLALERFEDNRLVDSVEELRQKLALERLLHGPLHVLLAPTFVGDALDHLTPHVAGHHDDRVGEIDRSVLAIGQTTIVEDLQKQIEHVVVSLLDFIEQYDAIRTSANRFGQLPSFFVSDVSRRGTDESAHGVPFHELAHVDSDHRRLVVEHDLGEGFAQFGFPNPGRS